eukprot:CAMPEP_0195517222 /NCGR_PEP_ID=MMETSP0794_2-20130614/10250_1 /TAXON_ID=515487 /ORGANISM="Stephanopyxis turris, Strain CCMP 815" /LENGTH=106 /DNA_ID=CAMNT_0040645995 /DNA_START=42 /DNA_END=363 /DNA_ORIENTATION=-
MSGSALASVVRIGAVVCGAIYGAKRLETLKAMEANGELPHQQAGASHHAHSVVEPKMFAPKVAATKVDDSECTARGLRGSGNPKPLPHFVPPEPRSEESGEDQQNS